MRNFMFYFSVFLIIQIVKKFEIFPKYQKNRIIFDLNFAFRNFLTPHVGFFNVLAPIQLYQKL